MKPFFQKILLLCLGLIVALALAEVGLRIGGISYPVFDAYDHDRAIALKPGKEGWYYGEGRAYLNINSLGYRDVEHTKQKPPGSFESRYWAIPSPKHARWTSGQHSGSGWKRTSRVVQNSPTTGSRC